ncbi:MAG: HRDC domain-containing protein, partial [Betaproteobacteria bacterium]|nr:HRDC domain-containing protein [Betaproteobacteria bacterium]
KGEVTVTLREATQRSKAKRRDSAVRSRERNAIPQQDDGLWQALRETRLSLAREQGVPPYVIFHDATLQAMLAARPSSLEDLRGISGVGEKKLERYGEAFLRVFAEHAEAKV